MDREKIYWKIKGLWDMYFSLTLQCRKQSQYYNANLKKIHTLYKNNISLYNSDFHFVEKFDFTPSEKTVHADDDGEYFGLEKSQVLEKDRKLVYLFDNHNKIIQPFLEYAEITGKGFDVVHIDAHDDDAVFASQKPHHTELKKIQNYITQTRISDFFDFMSDFAIPSSTHVIPPSTHVIPEFPFVIPAKAGIQSLAKCTLDSRLRGNDNLDDKLINNIHPYTKSNDFQEFKKPQNPYILSLDIDIFGPEGDFVDMESKIKIIAKAWKNAEVICIATSPGFIDQDFAQGIIKVFLLLK